MPASGFAGTNRGATILVAVVAPLVTAVVATHGRGRVRLVGIAVLTVAAATITVTGVTSADLINDGRSPVASRIGTFVPLDQTPVIRDLVSGSSVTTSPTPGPTPSPGEPDVVAPREVECSADGCAVEVRSPTITQTTTQER